MIGAWASWILIVMTIQSHTLLAYRLADAIEAIWGIRLSRKRLVHGSCKPDFTVMFVRHPHFWKHSKEFVFRKIERIAKGGLNEGTKNKKFCEELGVSLHYVADFFTAAHNISVTRLAEHLAFETELHDELDALLDPLIVKNALHLTMGDNAIGSLRERLAFLHFGVRDEFSDPRGNAKTILVACATVVSAIMAECLGSQESSVTSSMVCT